MEHKGSYSLNNNFPESSFSWESELKKLYMKYGACY